MIKDIRHQYFFEQPPAAVWEWLTQPALMEQWLMKCDFELLLGHSFQFRSNPAPAIEFDGIVYCTVVEIVMHKKLSYTWKCGPGGGRITIDSLVEWTLQPKAGGTELLLVHSGFKETDNLTIYAAMDKGWQKNIDKISEKIKAVNDGTNKA